MMKFDLMLLERETSLPIFLGLNVIYYHNNKLKLTCKTSEGMGTSMHCGTIVNIAR